MSRGLLSSSSATMTWTASGLAAFLGLVSTLGWFALSQGFSTSRPSLTARSSARLRVVWIWLT